MFQGIVAQALPIVDCTDRPGLRTISLRSPGDLFIGLGAGASVSVDGVCLTVSEISAGYLAKFDIMIETLTRTTLGELQINQLVNIERSLRFGDEIGGHLVSGHVDGTAEIVGVDTPENNHIITFQVSPEWLPFIFEKGSIAINGVSLTVTGLSRDEGCFHIYLIPETLRRTNLGRKKMGDKVNFEIDRQTQVVVETVRSMLPNLVG